MTRTYNVPGFTQIDDVRAWTADAQLGLSRNEDGTLNLLDSDGSPSNHSLAEGHAAYIIERAQSSGDDAAATMRRWDNYASSL